MSRRSHFSFSVNRYRLNDRIAERLDDDGFNAAAAEFRSGKLPASRRMLIVRVTIPTQDPALEFISDVRVDETNANPPRGKKSSTHRVFVRCPLCKEWVPFGRLHQHVGSFVCQSTQATKGGAPCPTA